MCRLKSVKTSQVILFFLQVSIFLMFATYMPVMFRGFDLPTVDFTLDEILCHPSYKLHQNNPCLIRHVQKYLLIPPSESHLLQFKKSPSLGNQSIILETIQFVKQHLIPLQNGVPGFFIECGSSGREVFSTTLTLEREYNWTGLIIETNKLAFHRIFASHRNAWLANVALSATSTSDIVTLQQNPTKLERNQTTGNGSTSYTVPVIPLYTLLIALDTTKVDFLTLKNNRAEYLALQTIPFDKVVCKVIVIKQANINGGQVGMIPFLERRGYKFIGIFVNYFTKDWLFVHNSIYTANMKTTTKPVNNVKVKHFNTT